MNEMDWELLDRYLSGEASREERERVEAWLSEDPEHWARLAALRQAIAEAALNESAVEEAKAEVWARLEREVRGSADVSGRVHRRGPGGPPRDFAPSSRRSWFTAAQLAAALLVAVIGGSALGLLLFRWRATAPAEAMRIATTTPGQRAMFRLADGTQVVLGVASTLRFPGDFRGGPREVSLDGEAYFSVVHDERRPFVVRARDLVAEDLGTEFTVRVYPEDAGASVVVREGRVAIRAAEPGAPERIVAPGQLGQVRPGREPTVEPADTAALFAWTEGRLVLDRIPLRAALPQLSRWFDLDFRLADSALGDVPLSATLRTRPTADVLNNLAASLGMKQRQVGRTVTLYSAEPER